MIYKSTYRDLENLEKQFGIRFDNFVSKIDTVKNEFTAKIGNIEKNWKQDMSNWEQNLKQNLNERLEINKEFFTLIKKKDFRYNSFL